jgi:hypothetical protein
MSAIKSEAIREDSSGAYYRFTVEVEGWRLKAEVNKQKRFSLDQPGKDNPWLPASVYIELPTKLTTAMAKAVAELMPLAAEKAAELDKRFPA